MFLCFGRFHTQPDGMRGGFLWLGMPTHGMWLVSVRLVRMMRFSGMRTMPDGRLPFPGEAEEHQRETDCYVRSGQTTSPGHSSAGTPGVFNRPADLFRFRRYLLRRLPARRPPKCSR
jgi:hypothetical protein